MSEERKRPMKNRKAAVPVPPEELTLAEQTDSTGQPKVSAKMSAEDKKVLEFVIAAARTMSDLHCENVIVLDVRALTPITDYILIATGQSARQINSIGGSVEDTAKEFGLSRYGRDEDGQSTWVVVDFVDAMVHLFDAQARAHYDLEMLWGDAPRIEWKR